MSKTHYLPAEKIASLRNWCGYTARMGQLVTGGFASPDASKVTCARCLAKLSAAKAPRKPRAVVVELEETMTAEEQARFDALPVIPR